MVPPVFEFAVAQKTTDRRTAHSQGQRKDPASGTAPRFSFFVETCTRMKCGISRRSLLKFHPLPHCTIGGFCSRARHVVRMESKRYAVPENLNGRKESLCHRAALPGDPVSILESIRTRPTDRHRFRILIDERFLPSLSCPHALIAEGTRFPVSVCTTAPVPCISRVLQTRTRNAKRIRGSVGRLSVPMVRRSIRRTLPKPAPANAARHRLET